MVRALWRVVRVLVVYAVFAAFFWVLIPPIRRTFLLPALFVQVAQGAVFVGALVAAVVAWRYPETGGRRPEGEEA